MEFKVIICVLLLIVLSICLSNIINLIKLEKKKKKYGEYLTTENKPAIYDRHVSSEISDDKLEEFAESYRNLGGSKYSVLLNFYEKFFKNAEFLDADEVQNSDIISCSIKIKNGSGHLVLWIINSVERNKAIEIYRQCNDGEESFYQLGMYLFGCDEWGKDLRYKHIKPFDKIYEDLHNEFIPIGKFFTETIKKKNRDLELSELEKEIDAYKKEDEAGMNCMNILK